MSAFCFWGSTYAEKSGLRASIAACTSSIVAPRSAMSRCAFHANLTSSVMSR